MNYRHAYHAGNFADVLKHAVLARIVEYLKRKEKPFRVIDTHAGAGLYDLLSDAAQKTAEWRDGIGRLMANPPEGETANLLKPLLDVVRAVNQDGDIAHYPGSPMIVRRLLRKQDRLTAIELHPQEVENLRENFSGDHQVRVIALDGWLALGAHLPPKEKRGLVLVDPPFEREGEFQRAVDSLKKAHRRWPGGIYAFWYPVKDRESATAFREGLKASSIPDILDFGVETGPISPERRLAACGMTVVNPPYILKQELGVLLPALARLLGGAGGGGFFIEQLTKETQTPS